MNVYTNSQIQDAIRVVESSITNCEKVQPKLKEGSPQLSLSKNRLQALYIVKSLLLGNEEKFTKAELEKSVTQITSIKSKSVTGIGNAKAGSATYTRFNKIIDAMDIVLDFLQNAMD